MTCIDSIRLDGFLSFPPGSPAFELQPLNVLIGPNGSGKSNFIDAFGLLAATPHDFAAAARAGGAEEWLWKGDGGSDRARIEIVLGDGTPTRRPLRYGLEFGVVERRVEVLDEMVEEVERLPGKDDVFFYYRFQKGRPAINVRQADGDSVKRGLKRESLLPDQSVLAQRKDPDRYPEVTWVGRRLPSFVTFREWTFGQDAPLRRPQPADLPDDLLLRDNRNLALVLNYIKHSGETRLEERMREFFPRFERLSTRVAGGAVQFYLHETGFASPIPATRLSDGTVRFMALLVTLLNPVPPPLVCIEEPELGLHPDAVSSVAAMLVEASERMQLVVTTHSESLVSSLSSRPEAVVTCARPGAGTELQRLDPDELASWLDDYGLDDLWARGVLGANP